MGKRITMVITIGVALLFLLSCSPQKQPTPAPSPLPPSTTAQPALAKPQAVAVSPEEAAWAKVVEAAKQEGKLTIYSYNFVGDIGIAMSRKFKERYGIPVDIVTGRGAEFLERLKTERRTGKLVGDLTEGSSLHINNMKNEGLTEGIASELPVLREKDVWVTDVFALDSQDKHVIIYLLLVYTPYINTNLVKPGQEPKTYKELLDPKWKGQMVLTDPLTSGGPEQYFVTLLRENVINEDFIRALGKQDLRYAMALPDEGGILSRGERSLSIRGNDNVYSRFVVEGAPIKAIALEDGTVASVNTIVTFKGAPHPNAAKVFINWFLSPEGHDVFCKANTVSSIRKDVRSYLPPAAQVTPKRVLLMTNEDNEKAGKLFREKWVAKLLGR